MEATVSKEKILHAIGLAEKISGKDVSHPILNNILLHSKNSNIVVRATNLDLGVEFHVPARISKEGVAVVSGKTLLSLVASMYKGVNVTLELDVGNLKVSDDGSESILKAYLQDDFPTIPDIRGGKGIQMEKKVFLSGLHSVWYSASTSTIKPELAGVYVYSDGGNLVFVATDSFRLAEKKVPVKKGGDFESILIPFRNIPEMIRVLENIEDDTVELFLKENQLAFSFASAYLTSRLVEGVFPDYRQIIPKEVSTEVIVLKHDLMRAFKKTGIFLDKFGQVSMRARPKKKTFSLHSVNADVGETNETVDAAIDGDDIDINFNQRYVTDCFQSIHTDSVSLQFVGLAKPMVIRGVSDTSFLYLVMPMNK